MMKRILVSFVCYLSACILVSLAPLTIAKLYPVFWPYAITWTIVCSLGIMAIWHVVTFGFRLWHPIAFLSASSVMVIAFFYSLTDKILSTNQLPAAARKVLLIESLPAAILLLAFLVIICSLSDEARAEILKEN